MKAVAVRPGHPNSVHLLDVPKPTVDGVPGGRGVLVRVLEVGVDGTDREINAGEYGAAPEGSGELILGHEGFGVVEEVAPHVVGIQPGDYVVAIVRRPGSSRYDVVGMPDMTTDDDYLEHGINLCHGFLTEYYVDCFEYLVRVPSGLRQVGVLLEPTSIAEKGISQAYEVQRRLRVWEPRRAAVLGSGTLGLLAALILRLRGLDVAMYSLPDSSSAGARLAAELGVMYLSARHVALTQAARDVGGFDLIFEATGFPPVVFDAMQSLAKNGVLVVSGVGGGDRPAEVPAGAIVRDFVLGNRAMVGTVNANRGHFEAGVRDLALAEVSLPGWLSRLITHRVQGLERYEELFSLLNEAEDAIKIVMAVSR